MAKRSFREEWKEDPRSVAAWVGGVGLVYIAIALVRPRWLTSESRRTWRRWLGWITVRLVLVGWYERWGKAWIERNQRAHADLMEELGRDPTPEEQMARMEQLAVDRS